MAAGVGRARGGGAAGGGGADGGAGGGGRRCVEAGGFGQPDGVGSVPARWSLVENERSWGKKKRQSSFKGGRPFVPVGGTNRT